MESEDKRGVGRTLDVLIKNGYVRVGDSFVCGSKWGKVRKIIETAGKGEPGSVITIVEGNTNANEGEGLGSNNLEPGDSFLVIPKDVGGDVFAKEVIEYRLEKLRSQ